jgi:hypothetical protein
MSPEKSSEISLETLIECFADLPDPRFALPDFKGALAND